MNVGETEKKIIAFPIDPVDFRLRMVIIKKPVARAWATHKDLLDK